MCGHEPPGGRIFRDRTRVNVSALQILLETT